MLMSCAATAGIASLNISLPIGSVARNRLSFTFMVDLHSLPFCPFSGRFFSLNNEPFPVCKGQARYKGPSAPPASAVSRLFRSVVVFDAAQAARKHAAEQISKQRREDAVLSVLHDGASLLSALQS